MLYIYRETWPQVVSILRANGTNMLHPAGFEPASSELKVDAPAKELSRQLTNCLYGTSTVQYVCFTFKLFKHRGTQFTNHVEEKFDAPAKELSRQLTHCLFGTSTVQYVCFTFINFLNIEVLNLRTMWKKISFKIFLWTNSGMEYFLWMSILSSVNYSTVLFLLT